MKYKSSWKLNLLWVRLLFVAVFLVSTAFSADSPREKLLMDSNWKFTNGDPSDAGKIFDYPESDLKKQNPESERKEAELASKRVDPVKTNLGGLVTWVKPEFDDAKWRTVNLPHDWAIEMPFSRAANNGKGSKQLDEIGVGNGDPSCHESDLGPDRSLFGGLALGIVQASRQAGNVIVKITAPGLKETSLTLPVKKSPIRPFVP